MAFAGRRGQQRLEDHPQTASLVTARRPRRSHESEESESDMTPMIDVTFQLIIFFMIAATYTVQKTLDMPDSNADSSGSGRQQTMAELEESMILDT